MSKHTHQKGQHSMTSFVRDNRTAVLYRSGILRPWAILCSTKTLKAGHYSSFFPSEGRTERKKLESVEEI
jgi:hypothetical protein